MKRNAASALRVSLILAAISWAGLELSKPLPAAARQEQKPRQQKELSREEGEDYFSRWLDQDVVYIITPAERAVFRKLSTDEEREQFIEQFWYRRDPDLRTSQNEFKEEHYRRIAYANEHFTSGVAGWKTDRGKIYIIHGPPVEINSHKMGQSYDRPAQEGYGLTKTLPFEVWRYRHIEGIGSDVEIEFVDPSGSGEFRLARSPYEKDAFLFTPGTAMTLAEQLGMASRGDHPYFSPATADTYPGMHLREKDMPFTRYETLVRVQQALPLKYKDLKQLVNVDVRYDTLPFRVRPDYFRLNDQRMLVPLTLQIANKNLTFAPESGGRVARVALYGMITSMAHRVITEFDDDLTVSYRPGTLSGGLLGHSVYQKVVLLDAGRRYRLDMVVKDLNSDAIGVRQTGLIVPAVPPRQLGTSSVILSDFVRELKQTPRDQEMFVLGDVKVLPNLDNAFPRDRAVWAYLHLYNAALDQTTFEPSLSVTYRVLKNGRKVSSFLDASGESLQLVSAQRVVLLKKMPLMNLKPDSYRLEVEIADRITGHKILADSTFRLTPGQEQSSDP
ncbi:MAG: GWxTD domain-containing protein [Acidobacteriota bacterium]